MSYVSSTTYNARGQVVEQRLDTGSNGLTQQYIYDQNTMRLTTMRAGVSSPYTNLQNLSYTYDSVGNIASLVDGVNSNQRQCYQYDVLDRLTKAFTGNSDCTAYSATGNYPYNHTYVYDAIGNITSYAGNAYSYSAGKPHAVSAAYGNSYGYDGNGNQTSRTIAGTTYSFVFDYENRLTEVKQGATSLATFLYDADGNRVKGTVSGVTTVYVAGIYERQGAAATSYYEGGGLRRSGYSSNNGVFYMLSDHLKSTAALVARNGVLNVKYFYYPYGARRGVPFNSITAKRFTGQYHEASLPGGEGLSFYNARWYDPKLGAFLSADSLVPAPLDPQSLNRYAYAGGNPLRFSDPSGHTKLCGAACEDGYQWSPVTKKGSGTSGGSAAGNISPGAARVVTRVSATAHPSAGEFGLDRSGWGHYRLPPAPAGFAWVPVVTKSGSTRIKITAYITVLESDRDAYAGPMVPIPGLEGSTPLIPQGMLDDLWEEGSLKLLDGSYIQRDWIRTEEYGYDVYQFVDPPPHAANGRVEAYSTGAAHEDLIRRSPPTVAYIVQLSLQITVNDSGGLLDATGPLDVYVGEGLAAEKNFGVHYSDVYILVPQ